MPSSAAQKIGGNGSNPKYEPTGVTGKRIVSTAISKVEHNNDADGRLVTQGRRVRMTRTISEAESTDSTNQPVRNCPVVECSNSSKTPNVK